MTSVLSLLPDSSSAEEYKWKLEIVNSYMEEVQKISSADIHRIADFYYQIGPHKVGLEAVPASDDDPSQVLIYAKLSRTTQIPLEDLLRKIEGHSF